MRYETNPSGIRSTIFTEHFNVKHFLNINSEIEFRGNSHSSGQKFLFSMELQRPQESDTGRCPGETSSSHVRETLGNLSQVGRSRTDLHTDFTGFLLCKQMLLIASVSLGALET
jgi:hypothetical protein